MKERKHAYWRFIRYPDKTLPLKLQKRTEPKYGQYGAQFWRTDSSWAIDFWFHKRLYVVSRHWYWEEEEPKTPYLCKQYNKGGWAFRYPILTPIFFRIHEKTCPDMKEWND